MLCAMFRMQMCHYVWIPTSCNFIVRLRSLPRFAEVISQGYSSSAVTPGLDAYK